LLAHPRRRRSLAGSGRTSNRIERTGPDLAHGISGAVLVGAGELGHSARMTCGNKLGTLGRALIVVAGLVPVWGCSESDGAAEAGSDEGGQTGAILPSDLDDAQVGSTPMTDARDSLAPVDEAVAE